ncbi:MAG: UDP-N-acetylglucosamine 2-epimerase (non-hydrolyzing) [Ignavibacteriae bacterium]|nr:UDP-N-acetylglucosamine 2-epimerase (non-hydrolyzing) [Ignavibacteriota bacterium]
MLKVMTIVGTRPEIIKLSCVINELEKYTNHFLVHTGQNYDYELNQIFFDDLNIKKPDYFLDAVGESTAQTIGNIITLSDKIIESENPDAILLYGDTNSCLSAISAKRRKIPIFHMEAGNRCFDQRVPEEINRKVIDHMSDINMTLTEHARRYLIREGIKPETIFKIGSSMREVLEKHIDEIEKSDILKKLDLNMNEYFLLSAHREENIDNEENFSDLISTLDAIYEKYQKQIIFSTHPRTMKKLEKEGKSDLGEGIRVMKPLGYFDYIKLQKNAFCVISDSGTITEESSILKFPAITIRESHERPEGMDEGTLIMSGLKSESVLNSINVVTEQHFENPNLTEIVKDYSNKNVSRKVVRIIHSYVDYVNKNVWKKS